MVRTSFEATLRADLIRDEGLVLKSYRDSVGKTTVGVGRNIEDVGLTEDEAMFLLANDIARVTLELDKAVPWWGEMPEPAQIGLANMCFNMGWPRLSQFRRMLRALEDADYVKAAAEALNSTWAGQVGKRSERIAALYRDASTGF